MAISAKKMNAINKVEGFLRNWLQQRGEKNETAAEVIEKFNEDLRAELRKKERFESTPDVSIKDKEIDHCNPINVLIKGEKVYLRIGGTQEGKLYNAIDALPQNPSTGVVNPKGQVSRTGGLASKILELLQKNYQVILNGAPGTGKTYMARNDIADMLLNISNINQNSVKNIRMHMVQFHPSYDYTDFIEGIRPNLSKNTTLTYNLKNGSFKSFCQKAGVLERIMSGRKEINKHNIKEFLKGHAQEITDYWIDIIVSNAEQGKYIDAIEQYNKALNEQNSVEEILNSNNVAEKNKELSECIQEVINSIPKFLFIIDEVNRAEISKVFGETMFCLDADYRGDGGRIATQYSTSATDETFFIDKDNDRFYIPSNVYIIGTMNDIDRSVEVFDFAMRRRFAWYEVKAEDVMDKVLGDMEVKDKLGNDYEDYKARISELNKAIEKDLNLSKHYHLGPSYFAKIVQYLENSNYHEAIGRVWENHIYQILNEYVKNKRGMEKVIENIKNNFINPKDKNTSSEGSSENEKK